jgi:hypothetical protein
MALPRLTRRLDAPEFFSACPLLAVALLGVNDAVLKLAFHNAITGKLSDFAGCFFLPLFTSALAKLAAPRLALETRLRAGVLVTLGIFVPWTRVRTRAAGPRAQMGLPREARSVGRVVVAAPFPRWASHQA